MWMRVAHLTEMKCFFCALFVIRTPHPPSSSLRRIPWTAFVLTIFHSDAGSGTLYWAIKVPPSRDTMHAEWGAGEARWDCLRAAPQVSYSRQSTAPGQLQSAEQRPRSATVGRAPPRVSYSRQSTALGQLQSAEHRPGSATVGRAPPQVSYSRQSTIPGQLQTTEHRPGSATVGRAPPQVSYSRQSTRVLHGYTFPWPPRSISVSS